jgi:hypothetical protein
MFCDHCVAILHFSMFVSNFVKISWLIWKLEGSKYNQHSLLSENRIKTRTMKVTPHAFECTATHMQHVTYPLYVHMMQWNRSHTDWCQHQPRFVFIVISLSSLQKLCFCGNISHFDIMPCWLCYQFCFCSCWCGCLSFCVCCAGNKLHEVMLSFFPQEILSGVCWKLNPPKN